MNTRIDLDNWEIQTELQDNGIYGMPILCKELYQIDIMRKDITENQLLINSAIIISLAEKYNERFKILRMDKYGVFIASERFFQRINNQNYILENNTLKIKI